MPTPFYHLSVAQDLLHHPSLPDRLRRFLCEHRSAFFLGKTAPDVQVLTGQPREDTHFYTIPVTHLDPAWRRMLEEHPGLARASGLPADQAAFVAGYLCHLQADQYWSLEIFNPGFGPDLAWETFPRRLFLHNVLRTHLDRQVLPELPPGLGAQISLTPVRGWLPFVPETALSAWRDYLAGQLQPGGWSHTVNVFAARHGLPVEAFYEVLTSAERLKREVFAHVSPAALRNYRRRLLQDNLSLLNSYLAAI